MEANIHVQGLSLSEETTIEISQLIKSTIEEGLHKWCESLQSKSYFNKHEAAEYMNISFHGLNECITNGLEVSVLGERTIRIAKTACDDYMKRCVVNS